MRSGAVRTVWQRYGEVYTGPLSTLPLPVSTESSVGGGGGSPVRYRRKAMSDGREDHLCHVGRGVSNPVRTPEVTPGRVPTTAVRPPERTTRGSGEESRGARGVRYTATGRGRRYRPSWTYRTRTGKRSWTNTGCMSARVAGGSCSSGTAPTSLRSSSSTRSCEWESGNSSP